MYKCFKNTSGESFKNKSGETRLRGEVARLGRAANTRRLVLAAAAEVALAGGLDTEAIYLLALVEVVYSSETARAPDILFAARRCSARHHVVGRG